jgi:DNA-binding CsgD family transcriptional regulator
MFFKKWGNKNRAKEQEIKIKRDLLIKELNDESLKILTNKHAFELIILERIEQELGLVINYDFLIDLKKYMWELHQMDLKVKLKKGEIESEFNYIKDVFNNKNEFLDELEIKLCAYFRLGFSSKEIAVIERIELNEVRFYKACIRRKLNLSTSTSLRDYLVFEEKK